MYCICTSCSIIQHYKNYHFTAIIQVSLCYLAHPVKNWMILLARSFTAHMSLLATIITHTHPFNGPLSGTTQVSRYQKGKTSLDFTEARDSEWQWHQLGHMQVCTSRQITTPAPHHSDFYRPDALPAVQPTVSLH